jgi:hypothetical protein
MKKRAILIASALLISVCYIFILVIAPIVHEIVKTKKELNNMEARRPILLYQTDHQALLSACRELSKQVITGQIKPYIYFDGEMNDIRGFPKIILDLQPFFVDIKKSGIIYIVMSPNIMYEVIAYPENYPSNEGFGIMLIEGLWYYDEDFIQHPEHMKEIEELLKERKSKELQGIMGTATVNLIFYSE